MGCAILYLIPTITIQPTKDACGEFWHVDIKCEYPSNIDRKEKLKIMREVKLEKCKRHCQYNVDRQGLDLILRTLFSDEFQNKHTYITLK